MALPPSNTWNAFDGQWLPDLDASVIGPKNYKTLKNLRHTDATLEGVAGYSKINTTALVTYVKIRSGIHFKKDEPVESHVLVQAYNSGLTASLVYENEAVIPAQGDFNATALHSDASGAGLGRFSKGPRGTVLYCNGKETMIWGGDESQVSAFITSTAAITNSITNPRDFTDKIQNTLQTEENLATIGGGKDATTVLLLHCDGADGSTTFTDAIGTHTPGAGGTNAQIDVDQAVFGSGSIIFDGSDYITIADHANFDFGTGTLTIDFRVRFNAVTGLHTLYMQKDGTAGDHIILWQDHTEGMLHFQVADGSAVLINESGAWAPVADTWYHVALIRGWDGNANDWAICVDGTAIHTFTANVTMPNHNQALCLGGNLTASYFLDYSGNTMFYEVANAAAVTATATKFGTASLDLNGSNQYAAFRDNDVFHIGGQTDATLLLWIKPKSATGADGYLYQYTDASNYQHISRSGTSNNKAQFYILSGGGSRVLMNQGPDDTLDDDWHSIVVAKVGDQYGLYVDGFQQGCNTYDAAPNNFTSAFRLGMANTYGDCYIDECFITHDNHFSVDPAAWITDSGNTSHGIASHNSIGSYYGFYASHSTKKWGTSSVYLDGSTGYLLFTAHANWDVANTTNVTIDLWVKHSDHAGIECYVGQHEGVNDWWTFRHLDGSGLNFLVYSGGVTIVSLSGGEITDTDWHHVAMCKVGTDWGIYLDGVQVAYVSDASTDTFAGNLHIGSLDGTNYYYQGYMDELRITHANSFSATPVVGLTDTITVPTAAHTSDANTKLLMHFDGDSFTQPTDRQTTDSNTKFHFKAELPDFNGWLDEVRVKKASAAWTEDFSLPIRAYSDQALYWVVGSTRPLKGLKVYVKNVNTESAPTITGTYWNGYSWTALTNFVDNTSGLTDSGTMTWDSTVNTAKPKFLNGYFLYFYQFQLSAGAADLYYCTVDTPFQSIIDIWDGVYRQPVAFQASRSSVYEDYTLEVNTPSTVSDPIAATIGGLTNTDHVIIAFEERMTAIKFQMIAGKTNTTAASTTIYYWDGSQWVSVGSVVDLTKDSGGTKTLNQTGVMSWTPPDIESEFQQELFGVTGYFYKLMFSATLTTGTGYNGTSVGMVTGIPAQNKMKPYKFPSMFKNMVMLCGITESSEGGRVDFSMPNAPDVYNGELSSMNGLQSLYFGGGDELTAATELYNRFGSNIFTTWVAFKNTETYLLTGEGPENFKIDTISHNIGCPAPLTLVTAETGYEFAEEAQRNIAIWLSNAGPMIFDAAVFIPLKGVESYFDPLNSSSINMTYIDRSVGWFDPVYKEYNLLIPTGTSETCNTWLVYDLIRKKWYQKDVPQPETEVTISVSQTDDDGSMGTGIWYTENNVLYIGDAGVFNHESDAALRFSTTIPRNAIIHSAYLSVSLTDFDSGLLATCYGIDEDNTATFSSTPLGRDKTTASVDFSYSNWDDPTALDGYKSSPDISEIIQEIVNRNGYPVSGGAIGLIIEDDTASTGKSLKFASYDYVDPGTFPPKLVVTYSVNRYPQAAFPVTDTYGKRYVFGAIDSGNIMRMENGTSWDGTAITCEVETGDFYPANSPWVITQLQQVKLALIKITEEDNVTITHYADTSSVSDGNWTLPAYSSGDNNRIVRDTEPKAFDAWTHRLKFSISTTETTKGFRPLGWGYQFETIRKDPT